jgi:hypothetical protein
VRRFGIVLLVLWEFGLALCYLLRDRTNPFDDVITRYIAMGMALPLLVAIPVALANWTWRRVNFKRPPG